MKSVASKRKWLERISKAKIAAKELLFLWLITNLPFLGTYLVKSSKGLCTAKLLKMESVPDAVVQQSAKIAIHTTEVATQAVEQFSTLSVNWQCLYSTLNHGEIFIYATSVLGTIPIVINRYNERKEKYPQHLYTMLFLVLGIFISALFFSLHQTDQIVSNTASTVAAALIYPSVTILWFISIMNSEKLGNKAIESVGQEASEEFSEANEPSNELRDYNG